MAFSIESLLDEAARKLGLGPFELRLHNALKAGSKTASGGSTIVNAEIDQPQGEPIKLDFIVQNVGQGLKVTDVKVEGVSLLVTKRSEFDSVVAQRGVVDGAGNPQFYFDERLVKGKWPPKGMSIPRVVVSSWQTDL